MVSLLGLAQRFLYVVGVVNPTAQAASHSTQRPTYAIAHRVLRPSAVTAALSHGANAIEIDLTAKDRDWWTDHDGAVDSAGGTARDLFQFIANERQNGQNIIFVWLDIKNPDYCVGPGSSCSIEALRDLVRETLEPAGVKALYGFFQTERSRGYTVMKSTLGPNEAIVLSGTASTVLDLYNATHIPPRQRIMDYGFPQLDHQFGDCHEPSDFICTELRAGDVLRENNQLGRVMGWTSTQGDTARVDMLLSGDGVDGIIYGFQESDYADDPVPKAAFQDILNFVHVHSESRRMATVGDNPW